MLTKNKDGQYFYNDQKVLVRYLYGGVYPRKNPRYYSDPVFEAEYYPDWRNNRVGVMIALKIDGEIRYGFSRANTLKGDKFDRQMGLELAFKRAMENKLHPPFENLLDKNSSELLRMQERSERYFYKY